MTESSYHGHCLCGALAYEVAGPLENVCFCHCESCRRASGAPFVAWGTCPAERFEMKLGELARFHSSPPVTRGFCRRCGTSVTYAHEGRPGELDIAIATFDDPGDIKPEFHIWLDDKLAWVEISDDLPQYAQWRSP